MSFRDFFVTLQYLNEGSGCEWCPPPAQIGGINCKAVWHSAECRSEGKPSLSSYTK